MSTWLEFEKPVLEIEQQIEALRSRSAERGVPASAELKELEARADQLRRDVYANLTPFQRVQVAKHPQRPYTLDYIAKCCTDFLELHGDRHFGEDPAIVGGPG
ncbi:MAG: acetyl-CoA carboxylase carboxyl transferase subunit alpha, partial [Candidatus Eiseniibacteriota bacterium]